VSLRLNIRKATLRHWREQFATHLQDLGIDGSAPIARQLEDAGDVVLAERANRFVEQMPPPSTDQVQLTLERALRDRACDCPQMAIRMVFIWVLGTEFRLHLKGTGI
jgi:hypothetical protein